MRKIYSLVLMTAMLFVGANAWGATYNVNVATYDQLIAAVEGPSTGEGVYQEGDSINITLTDHLQYKPNFNYQSIGTTQDNASRDHVSEIVKGQKINLNLAGYNIESEARYVFAMYKGKLYITGQGTISNLCHRYKANGTSKASEGMAESSVVFMCGTNDANCDPHRTYLYVGSEVSLMCNEGKCGIYVNQIYGANTTNASSVKGTPLQYGSVSASGKQCAYGVYADVYGKVHGHRYGMQMSGNIKEVNQTAGISLPTYHIHSSAVVWADHDANECCGVYVGGYSKVIVNGTCYGSTGVYVKSGVILIDNATVYSDATNYKEPTNKSGADAAGSGVIMDTNSGYAGEMEVTVSGDSHITGSTGYAIEENVTQTATEGQTNVDALIITGGTFDTGASGKGAITISENTANANQDNTNPTNVTIGGGNVSGTIAVGDNDETPHDLNEVVKPAEGSTGVYATFVEDENGKTTMVISQGAAPEDKTTVNNQTGTVNWKHDDSSTAPMTENITTNTTLDALTMNQAYTQALYVKAGVTLTVGRIIMGADAHIIVEPTAKLIVNGTEGIVTTSVTNLVLQANETTQGALLFNPNANSNRQPHAQVQYTTVAYQKDATTYQWQRITSPMAEVTEVTYTLGGKATYGGAPFGSDLREWDYSNKAWSTTSLQFNQMKPFVGYALTNNCVEAGVRYNFKGRIQGTVSDELVFKTNGFNYFGNAYTSSMHIEKFLENLQNNKVEQTLYVWDAVNQRYITTSRALIGTQACPIDTIPTLQTIVLRLNGADASEMTAKLNYAKSVWEWGTKTGDFAPSSSAPQRVSDYNSVRITVTAADGSEDFVTFIEKADFSENYESGADALKLMNENHINFYAIVDDAQAIVATDNMVGTLLSLQTLDEVSYTLSFNAVNGEVYALRDNMTNTIVMMNEGATYNFTAQSNATLDGRFQIVSRQEMPTAVETIEETVAPKAIYTIMGQYVGETTDWNTLPAGVYVVDGVKIVK